MARPVNRTGEQVGDIGMASGADLSDNIALF
jgi:hypothetical protein